MKKKQVNDKMKLIEHEIDTIKTRIDKFDNELTKLDEKVKYMKKPKWTWKSLIESINMFKP